MEATETRQEEAIAKRVTNAGTPLGPNLTVQPRNFGELFEYARWVAYSGMVPKQYQENPGAVIVAMQMGAELGLSPLAALQNIAVINGRPSVWGDAGLAIVKTHPEFDGMVEQQSAHQATCTIKRRGQPDVTITFTLEDAKAANLLSKDGPWKQYPKRMMQMRARWFAMRDQFPDALRGISSAEEGDDSRVVDPITKWAPLQAEASTPPALEPKKTRTKPTLDDLAKPALVLEPQAAPAASEVTNG